MAENLRFIPHVSSSKKSGGIWVYGFENDNVSEAKYNKNYLEYGCLYDWKTACKVAPVGWHLPHDDEYEKLIDFLGGKTEGDKLKEIGTTHWHQPNEDATDKYGFTALPGGIRKFDGSGFHDLGLSAEFWTTRTDDENLASAISLTYSNQYVMFGNYSRQKGVSVRCILDFEL